LNYFTQYVDTEALCICPSVQNYDIESWKLIPNHYIALERASYEVVEDKPVIVQSLATGVFIFGRR
jgi:hypothetical protein